VVGTSGTNDLADQINANSTRPESANKLRQYFNTAAFVQNAAGTFGNSGRNSMTGPGAWNWDLALVKNVAIREPLQLGFRFEAFNLLNHANFNNPNATLTSPNFGTIVSASSPRVLQLALKLNF